MSLDLILILSLLDLGIRSRNRRGSIPEQFSSGRGLHQNRRGSDLSSKGIRKPKQSEAKGRDQVQKRLSNTEIERFYCTGSTDRKPLLPAGQREQRQTNSTVNKKASTVNNKASKVSLLTEAVGGGWLN